MSQVSGDYNQNNSEEWSNYNVNEKDPSDLHVNGQDSFQKVDGAQENLLLQPFGKIAHTEESILRSAILSDHLTDAEFKKSKWKSALDNTGKLGRLKYGWNKVKTGIHAFVNSFERRRPVGNLKSRSRNELDSIGMFVKSKESSSLPTFFCSDKKKDFNVNQEILSLYMDGIELGNIEIGKNENKVAESLFINKDSLIKENNLNFIFPEDNSQSTVNKFDLFFFNKVVNYGQLGEDKFVESEVSAITRRVFTSQTSSDLRYSQEVSSFIGKNVDEKELSEEGSNLGIESGESKISESQKKTKDIVNAKKNSLNKSSDNRKQEINKFKFLKKDVPVLVENVPEYWGSSSHTSFRLPQSGNKLFSTTNFSFWGRKNNRFLDSSQIVNDIEPLKEESDNNLGKNLRFQQEVNTGFSNVSNDYDILNNDNLGRLGGESLSYSQDSSKNLLIQNEKESYLINSAYSFLGFSGFSAESIQRKEEEKLLSEQQRAAVTANVLVYQYRTIGLNPPIIFRKPASYLSAERPYIIGKPAAEEDHNENNQEGESFLNNDENKEINDKRNPKE